MEIYAPSYCKEFKCIADKCRHSCCVGWEIDVDEKTHEKYKALDSECGKRILENIEEDSFGAHFTLDKEGRCKNLDSRGLCKIITALGENYLCDICRLHPRFFNTVGGRIEMGLGLSCEEAVRLTLGSKAPFTLEKAGENEESAPDNTEFSALPERDRIIAFMEKADGTFYEKLLALEEKYGASTDSKSYGEWIDFLLSLEILDGKWKAILEEAKEKEPKSDISPYGSAFEALFKYFVFRHVSTAESESALRARLAFATLGVRLVAYIAEREDKLTLERLYEIVRLYSSEIEYSEDNTDELIFELEMDIM